MAFLIESKEAELTTGKFVFFINVFRKERKDEKNINNNHA